MISYEAKIAVQAYLGSIILTAITGFICSFLDVNTWTHLTLFTTTAIIFLFLLWICYKGNAFQIAIRAGLLGIVFGIGLYVRLSSLDVKIFGAYMCVMSFFHFSEFVAIAIVQPKHVSTDSFVINHSLEYTVAATTSWIEFFLEAYFMPSLKQFHWLSNFGLLTCICGDLLRKVAMLTAGSSFHHLVQSEKSSEHVLVTHGVYSWFRHPSYVGWFYWSIGTQIILLNPLCIPAYALASWHFFKSRIYIEEITLLNFFGQNYCDYQKRVNTGIPFIEGYKI